MRTIDEFARMHRLQFNQPELLTQALTHRSYLNEHEEPGMSDNQRLEFLGDAVIGFIAGEWLFNRYPAMNEGDLTRLRAALVQRESLAELARADQIGVVIRIGKGEEANGARDSENILCDAFEAVVGALFLDQGMDGTRRYVIPRLEDRLERVLKTQLDRDARSQLQEWSQAHYNLTPRYEIVEQSGPDHDKQFTIEVMIGSRSAGRGIGRSKQSAAQAAARDALMRIENEPAP